MISFYEKEAILTIFLFHNNKNIFRKQHSPNNLRNCLSQQHLQNRNRKACIFRYFCYFCYSKQIFKLNVLLKKRVCPCYATVQVFAIDPCQYVHILIMDIRKLTLVNKNENMQNSMRKIIFNIFK